MALVLAGCVALGGCADASRVAAAERSADPVSAPSASTSSSGPVPDAPVGRPARSTRVHFVPELVVLPGGSGAAVLPAATVDGELKVPENVRHVGWWDASADAGDPFGHTVIAGHVDSATDGLGFFARLLDLRKGDVVTLRGGDGHRLGYRVTSVVTVKKNALASNGRAFVQDGDHRLVLITCGGAYHKDRGGYDSNVVVTATPLGLAR